MTTAASLLALALLSVPAAATLAQAQSHAAAITVTRAGDGCDITLSPAVAKMVQDQVWLVIDGKSEGLGGDDYAPDDAAKPLHFVASVSSNLDGQVKDILKAQGVSVDPKIVTYRISFGVNRPDEAEESQTLHFRHGSNILAFTPHFGTAAYKVGDKITIFDAVALDSSITMPQALGPHNDISTGKFVSLPHDLLHRITLQVQFMPKPPSPQ